MNFSIKLLLLSLPLLTIPFLASPAQAERIKCESTEGRRQRCSMDTRGGVELIRVLSQTSCRNRWRYGRGYVEVRDGCRAEFESYRSSDWEDDHSTNSRDRVICESKQGRTKRCAIDAGRRGVRLVRELSDTSCRDRWYYEDGYVYVEDGCRGEFVSRQRY